MRGKEGKEYMFKRLECDLEEAYKQMSTKT